MTDDNKPKQSRGWLLDSEAGWRHVEGLGNFFDDGWDRSDRHPHANAKQEKVQDKQRTMFLTFPQDSSFRNLK